MPPSTGSRPIWAARSDDRVIAALVAAVVLGGIATRLVVTSVAYGALSGTHRPALRAVWVISLAWVIAIGALAAFAVAR